MDVHSARVVLFIYYYAGPSVRRQKLCGAHRVEKVYVSRKKEVRNDKRRYQKAVS